MLFAVHRNITKIYSNEPVKEPIIGDKNLTDPDIKVILLWNSFYESVDYGVGALGRKAFTKHKCQEDKCRLETDHRLFSQSAAVVFHMKKDIPRFPERTSNAQLFVFFLRESPHHSSGHRREYRSQFNVTMTYRVDSDIPVPLVKMVSVPMAPSGKYKLKYALRSRPRSVVWLVSHCKTPSKREVYVAALAKHIGVDIYGNCGKLKCAIGQPCMRNFERKYKFYLGLENSYCADYVTEKYYRTLRYEIIPIVYGRANYTSLGPSGAFIDILNYRSPKDLADYLHYLAKNETAYSEYFQWKPYWRAVPQMGPAFCKLCEIVHSPMYTQTYTDVRSWWANATCDLDTVNRLVASTKLPANGPIQGMPPT
jgi:alpha-1,3-fucosyltransferase